MKPEDIQKILKETGKIADNTIDMMELLSAALVTVAQSTAKKSSSPEECAKGLALIVYEKILLAQTIASLLKKGESKEEVQKAIDKIVEKLNNNEIPEWLK